jgi:hypothetical protein
MTDLKTRTMFQIQYVKNGNTLTIPIFYDELDDAKKDAAIFKPELDKTIIDFKTKKVIVSIPSSDSYPKFLNFTS